MLVVFPVIFVADTKSIYGYKFVAPLTLIWVGGNFTPPPTPPPLPTCLFFLNNSEMVKAVTQVFHSIQQLFIIDIRAKFGVPNLRQSLDIRQNSDIGISAFRISGQFLVKENCHNSRTGDDIDMKFGPVTKL